MLHRNGQEGAPKNLKIRKIGSSVPKNDPPLLIYVPAKSADKKKALRRHVPRTPIGPALGVKDKRTPLNGC